ncbi:MAG: hypothetical protein LBC83_00710 [Oscillospiraceae bacterium]|jgi:DhnA family fructose-bisphosphate aldolase class Ia|nr:hypothetical protein [Oscillospiraceae bacterium]
MRIFPYTGDHRQLLAAVLIAAVLLGAGAIGYLIYCRRKEEQNAAEAAEQLTKEVEDAGETE